MFKAALFLQGYYMVGSTDWMCFGVREISLFWKILDKSVIEFSLKKKTV